VNVSIANIGLLVHKMCIPEFKHKMQTWNLFNKDVGLRKRIFTIFLKIGEIREFFTDFKTVGHEFSIYGFGTSSIARLCLFSNVYNVCR